MRTLFIVGCILLLSALDLHGQESVAVARDLYTAASYEEALAVLNRLDSANTAASERMAVNQYRAFCLLALGRMQEAERAIEAVLTVDLLYRPADATMSPRLRTAFAGVRQRILPAIVQHEYSRAKAAFDRGDFASAVAQFDRVLQALSDPDLGAAAATPPLADLRTLATGFRDLGVKAAAPPPVLPAAPPPVAPVVSRAAIGIYSGTEPGVLPAVTVRQSLPTYQGDLSVLRDGVLEVIINEIGDVEWAAMRSSVTARYDQILLSAVKNWKYQPATLNGTPVKFRKIINISIKPPVKGPFGGPGVTSRR
jgi:tetratricopeptide (TPR) repeat protein